ncbi:MAG: DUF4340 domain-containing protein [Thermodesulfobacteriota bacterium]
MLTKRNRILLGLLCLQVVLIAIVFMPRPQGGAAKVFFEGLKPEAVARLTVATADGRTLSVSRQGKGWVVESPPHYPADRDKIENLLTRLVGLRSDRLVAQTGEAHNRFQVGPSRFGQKVTLTLTAGGERILYLGSSPNYTSVHVRAEGDDKVYLVNELAGWQVPADEKFWLAREYVAVNPEALREIRLVNSAGAFRLVKGEKGWRLAEGGAGSALDGAKVQAFVTAASRIALTDYLGQEERPEYGLTRPLATLVLATREGTVTLAVGAREEKGALGGTYVMKSSTSPFYARGGSAVLAPLVGGKVADLVAGNAAAP